MTYGQNPPDGTPRQPSYTPYTQDQQPYQQPPAYPAGPPPYQQPPGYGYAPGGPPQRRKRHILRNILAGIGAVVVVVIIVTALADAGGTHSVTTAGSSNPAAHAKAKGAGNHTAVTQIGSSISLAGNTSGEQMGVTVVKVLQHPAGADEFSTPSSGDRFFAVQFRLADTGTAAYSDAPLNGAAVIDSAGQSYQSDLVSNVAGCHGFAGTENIAPGSSGLGCIVFDVPVSAKITLVQFTLDSGFGPQTGQWDVSPRS